MYDLVRWMSISWRSCTLCYELVSESVTGFVSFCCSRSGCGRGSRSSVWYSSPVKAVWWRPTCAPKANSTAGKERICVTMTPVSDPTALSADTSHMLVFTGPWDCCGVENLDRITESRHENRIYCITPNVMEWSNVGKSQNKHSV